MKRIIFAALLLSACSATEATLPDNDITTVYPDSTGSETLTSHECAPTTVCPEGPEGPIGLQGLKGDTGEQGTYGLTGGRGERGIAGPQGPQGATGLRGVTGPRGFTGSVGVTGAVGATGSAGPQGVKGNTGSVGSEGPAGADGADGAQGETGAEGATITKWDMYDATNSVTLTDKYYVKVFCRSATDVLMHGGCSVKSTSGVYLTRSEQTGPVYGDASPAGWMCSVNVSNGTLTASATCLVSP